MLPSVIKYQRSPQRRYKFSVVIPSWNNKEYLELCVKSILKNSLLDVQIIVIVNEGVDGTIEWIERQPGIDYLHAQKNIGICYGVNIGRSLVKSDYIVYANDDMYLLPQWDSALAREIDGVGGNYFMLSGTMIEPVDTGNPCVIVKDYGRDREIFNEALLLKEYSGLCIDDWSGGTWPPCVVHVDLWDLVGGFSIEYNPGMYSDPDFSRKLFEAGVRLFKGKGNSLAYHFGSKSTRRIAKNKGRKTFLLKWGITPGIFVKKYLRLGKKFSGQVSDPALGKKTLLVNKIKKIISC